MRRTYTYNEKTGEMTCRDVRCDNEKNHPYLSVPCSCGFQPEATSKLYTGRYA